MQHPGAIAFLTTNWPNAFPTPQAASDWDRALNDLAPAQVLAAVKRIWSDEPREFKPTPGQVRKLIGSKAPAREPSQEDHAARAKWDREKSISAAKSWAGAIDMLERQGRLESSRSALLDACETLAKEADPSDHWLAARCLERLDALGIGPGPEAAKWRAKLGDASPAIIGEPIGEDLDFGNPERWSEEI